MYEIDGIRIGDNDYDRVCLNCRYWQVNVQIRGAANGVVCTKGQGQTDPNDSCSLFSPNSMSTACRIQTDIRTKGIK